MCNNIYIYVHNIQHVNATLAQSCFCASPLVSPIASVLLHLFLQLPNSTQAVSMHINCHFTVAEACDEEDDKVSLR